MPFEKGNKLSPGRTKGVVNKSTKAFKDLLTETYRALEDEEGHGLLQWSKDNPTDFYRICAKLIPIEITGKDGNPIQLEGTWIPPSSPAKSKS